MAGTAAVILAGGRSTRMPGNKLALVIDGRTLLERAVAAATAVSHPVVVAGPRPHWWPDDGTDVTFVVEDPPFGGPVAGIAAALPRLGDADDVFLLAGDLADPASVVRLLCDAELAHDGVVLEDVDGVAQPLAGRYRLAALRAAVERLGHVRNVEVRTVMRSLSLMRLPAPEPVTRNVDTPAAAHAVRAIMPRASTP